MAFTSKSQTMNKYKKQLDSIQTEDQKFRPIFKDLLDPNKKDSLVSHYEMSIERIEAMYDTLQEKLDSTNLLFIEEFISRYGYPGKSMVGEPSNEVAWYVIQHSSSEKIEKYFKIIKKAGQEGEIPYKLVAMMEDRLLVGQNKEQIYGTQIARRKLKSMNQETVFVWPIKSPKGVNKRRKKAGFSNTVEENAKRFHIQYTEIKLNDILPLKSN